MSGCGCWLVECDNHISGCGLVISGCGFLLQTLVGMLKLRITLLKTRLPTTYLLSPPSSSQVSGCGQWVWFNCCHFRASA